MSKKKAKKKLIKAADQFGKSIGLHRSTRYPPTDFDFSTVQDLNAETKFWSALLAYQESKVRR